MALPRRGMGGRSMTRKSVTPMRAAPARVGPPVRVARGPRRAAGRRSVRGVRVECRNRILFRREVRPSPPPWDPRESRLLTARAPLLLPQEVDESDDGAESITLALGDSRSEHVRGVLKLAAGDSLRVGVVNGSPATAVVSTMDETSMTLTWRPGVETLDVDTARRSLTAPLVDVDLLLAMPRPKVMTRLWAPLASIGVRNVYLTNASRVERYYWDSTALDEAKVIAELTRGMEQSGDVRMPGVCVVRRFPAAVDAVREMTGAARRDGGQEPRGRGGREGGGNGGGMPREGSAFWLVKPPPADENDDDDDAEVVMLTAHPGAVATVGDAFGDLSSSSSSGRPPRTRAVVAVGPEGGWTDFERRSLLDAGFVEVALGRRTFATDVACVALVAAVRERTSSW